MATIGDVICGLTILAKYASKKSAERIEGADNDVIYGTAVDPKCMSDSDRDAMKAAHWYVGEFENVWYIFT